MILLLSPVRWVMIAIAAAVSSAEAIVLHTVLKKGDFGAGLKLRGNLKNGLEVKRQREEEI